MALIGVTAKVIAGAGGNQRPNQPTPTPARAADADYSPLDYAWTGLLWLFRSGQTLASRKRAAPPEAPPTLAPPAALPEAPASEGTTLPVEAPAAAAVETVSPDLLAALSGALHLLIIGPSRAGKTSLVHELAMRWKNTSRVIVCDPDAAPGLWPGCEVYGAGDDFTAIDTALKALEEKIGQRRADRARGVRQFAPMRVILSEYSAIADECEGARGIIEDCLRRGAKLGISLVLDVQDKQRKTLNLDGATHLLGNFSHVCEVRKAAQGQRSATVTVNDGANTTMPYPIPALPDLDALIIPVEPVRAPVLPPPAGTPNWYGTSDDRNNTDTDDLEAGTSSLVALANQAANPVRADTDAPVPVPPAGTPLNDDDLIAELVRRGVSANQIAQVVGGTRAAVLERVRRLREGSAISKEENDPDEIRGEPR